MKLDSIYLVKELRKDPSILNDYLIDNDIHRQLFGAETLDEYGTKVKIYNLFDFLNNEFIYWPIKEIYLDKCICPFYFSFADIYMWYNFNPRIIEEIPTYVIPYNLFNRLTKYHFKSKIEEYVSYPSINDAYEYLLKSIYEFINSRT